MLKKIIAELKVATGLDVFPWYTDELEDCLVYEWTPRRDDGATQSAQILIRVISADMESAEDTALLVRKCLLKAGDGAGVRGLTACELNGGGCLVNPDTGKVNYLMYFDLGWKSEIGE